MPPTTRRSSSAQRARRVRATSQQQQQPAAASEAKTKSPPAIKDDDPALVLPPQFSRRILCASSLMLLSFYAGLYNGLHDNAFLALLVFCSSINYWRLPVLGWRRSFDMCCANGSLAYQFFYTSTFTSAEARTAYRLTVAAGGVFYMAARSFNRYLGASPKTRPLALNYSSACHVCLHICGNVGNLLLYDSLGVNWAGWPR